MMTPLAILAACALLALLYVLLRHAYVAMPTASRTGARGGLLAYPAPLPPPALSCRVSAACPVVPSELDWRSVTGLTKGEAEELLDWLEGLGFREREVGLGAAGGFTVRYK